MRTEQLHSSLKDSIRRIFGLVRKESLQILRDPSSYLIAVFLPLLLMFIFSFGVSLDLNNIPIGIVIEQSTPETTSLLASFRNSKFFNVIIARHRNDLEEKLVSGQIKGVIIIAQDFSRELGRKEVAPIQVIVDGSDPNTANLALGYIQGIWINWLQQEAVSLSTLAGREQLTALITPVPRYWYNPSIRSQNFLIPGSIAITMSLIGTMLTALVVAREWERGTMEALLATPVHRSEFLLGKLIPYFLLGTTAMVLSVVVAVCLMSVPFRGSYVMLFVLTSAFLLAMLPLGLLISTLTRNQFAASQAALISAFLPAFELSGFIFEIDSMPWAIRVITYVLPARYFVSGLQTIFLAGDVGSVLWPNLGALFLIALLLMTLLVRVTRTRLE